MKIIFLDIDGVLNSEAFFMKRAEHSKSGIVIGSYQDGMIDPNAVTLLNSLIEQTGAKIVVSSTWRHDGLESIKKLFHDIGCVGEVIDITPSLRGPGIYRGNEIARWLIDHRSRPESDEPVYVILDDDSDMLLSQRDSFIWGLIYLTP